MARHLEIRRVRPPAHLTASLARLFCWVFGLAAAAFVLWLCNAALGPTAAGMAGQLRLVVSSRASHSDVVAAGHPERGHDPVATATRRASAGAATPVATTTDRASTATAATFANAAVTVATATDQVSATSGTAAAPTSVWDELAKCESSGNWRISNGNGYHGGLQFKPSTWRAFGGTRYAASADKATKTQQIEIARKVQAKQGWNAWPTCSRKVNAKGKSKVAEKPEVDERTPAPKADRRSGKPDPQILRPGTPEAKDAKKVRPEATDRKRTKAEDKDRERGTAVEKDVKRGKAVQKGKVGRDAGPSKRYGPKRLPAATTPTLPAKPGEPVATQVGDSLSKIAKDNKIAGGWRAVFELNRDTVRDPNLIRPGQRLRLSAGK